MEDCFGERWRGGFLSELDTKGKKPGNNPEQKSSWSVDLRSFCALCLASKSKLQ